MRGACTLLAVTMLSSGPLVTKPAAAQTVEFRSGAAGLPEAEDVLLRILRRGDYVVITRDTVLGPQETISSDVILLGSALRVEGRVASDLVAVQADLFARPGGTFEGTVVVLGGGFYGTTLARLRNPPLVAAGADYAVEERDEGERYLIFGPGGRTRLHLPGLYGLLLPEYERVSALAIDWGIELESVAAAAIPEARAAIRLRTGPGEVDGDLELRWPLRRHAVVLRGGRTYRSNDRWINGDVVNSVYAILAAVDTRNYYDARFVETGLQLGYGTRIRWQHGLLVGWERARSLENRDPFSIATVRGGFQPVLPVDEADIVGLRIENLVEVWTGTRSILELGLDFEAADRAAAGDLTFGLLEGAARARFETLGGQYVLIAARGQFPTSSSAPRQRWRGLGGWGTLPTLRPVERVGDRLWWVEATYRVPLSRRLGFLGELVPWARYASGNAWTDEDDRPDVVHNVGLGLMLGRLSLAVYSDPGADFKTVAAVGFEAMR